MHPVIRLRLTHPEQASMEHLNRILLEIDENEQQTICWGRQGAVLIGRIFSRLSTWSKQRPFGHVSQERCLKRGKQRLKFVDGQARQIS
jgi:hypothetical protein